MNNFSLKKMEQKLQKADRKHARLYLFCNFMALMITSAFSALMLSPTVQTVFPKGGDSRKQMNAIFVLTLVGCVIFTMYASGLFFRHKSGQLGILMALGASRKRLVPGLLKEVLFLSGISSIAGILAGFPFVWIIWRGFRLFLVDSSDMYLTFDLRCLFVSVAFFALVVGLACFNAWTYLRRTNIMEIILEEHINEPVKELGRWCGPVGFLLILLGAIVGYCAPSFWLRVLYTYPPSWIAVFFAPVFVGVYMVMLHTVVHGWRNHKKNPYKNIISRSMMKFQGKQTVNNMIVVTLLIAGACFAIFYVPASASPALFSYAKQPFDYFYHYRADQKVPGNEEIAELAKDYGLTLKDWSEYEYITLGIGGRTYIEEEDGAHFHVEYVPVLGEAKVLSEDAYRALTGERAEISPGTYLSITNEEETSQSSNETAVHLTNMVAGKQLVMAFAGYLHYDLLTDEVGYYVIDNGDYEQLAEGLSDDWRGKITAFNVAGKDSYEFANDFFHRFVASFDETCEHDFVYDRVAKIVANEKGETYWVEESDEFDNLRYEDVDTSAFRSMWAYRPSFRILSQNDYLLMMAVFFMMFLFIFIVCLMTALVICYTRCQTIVLNNRYIFVDLKKLGASPKFLSKEVDSQCSNVFKIPALVGSCAMTLLFSMILYANDGKIVFAELIGLLVCLVIVGLISVLIYIVYRCSTVKMKKQLNIAE